MLNFRPFPLIRGSLLSRRFPFPGFRSKSGMALKAEDVQKHLVEMKHVYNNTSHLSALDLYLFLRNEETAYINSRNLNNFGSMVHKLHPVKYARDISTSPAVEKIAFKWGVSEHLRCQHCHRMLDLQQAYNCHIGNSDAMCSFCKRKTSYQSMAIQAVEKRWNLSEEYLYDKGVIKDFPKALPVGGCNYWDEFRSKVRNEMPRLFVFAFGKDEANVLRKIQHRYSDNLSSLSLDLVKGMYRQLDFVNKVCCNFDYWMQPQVLQQSAERYHKFMGIIAGNKEMLVPTMDIDLAWHAHQSQHHRYAEYCKSLRGDIIDHDDTIPAPKLVDAYANTAILWSQRYGEPYSHTAPEDSLWWKLFHNKTTPLSAEERKKAEQAAIVGTPVMDSLKRPSKGFDQSLYVSLAAMAPLAAISGCGSSVDAAMGGQGKQQESGNCGGGCGGFGGCFAGGGGSSSASSCASGGGGGGGCGGGGCGGGCGGS